MIRKIFAALVLLLGSLDAAGQEVPFGFGAVGLGASVAEYQAAYPGHDCPLSSMCFFTVSTCIQNRQDIDSCMLRNRWANLPSKSAYESVYATFKDGRVVRVTIGFAPADFDLFVQEVQSRYGPAARVSRSEFSTRSGPLQNEEHVWERGENRLVLLKHIQFDISRMVMQSRESHEADLASQKDSR